MQARLVEAVRARDAETVAELFAPDGTMLLQDGTVLVGRAQIGGFWTERWAAGGPNPYKEYPGEPRSTGPLVLDGGGFGPEESRDPVGHYVRVWRLDETGAWRIHLYYIVPL